MWKAASTFKFPLQWKGSQSDITNYRDVMVADASGKTATGLLRDAAVPMVSAMVGDTQLGAGSNHGSTATAHLMARAYVDIAQVRKVSVALLFVDLRSAFASVARRLAIPTGVSDDVWRQRLVKNGYSNEAIERIFSDSRCACDWRDNGGSKHLLLILRELHVHTWASFEGLAGVIESK